jgi:hypothetical protein
MNEPRRVSVSSVREQDEPRGGRKRTLAEALLISIWVAGYAVIVVAFQFAKVLESILPNHQRGSPGQHRGPGE